MSVEENKAIARRHLKESWAHPDILDEIVAADVVWHCWGIDCLEAYKQSHAKFRVGFPDVRVFIDDIIAEADRVVVRWMVQATHRGEWAGVTPTNRRALFQGMTAFRIAGGKIVEIWQLTDDFQLWRQLDVIPPWKELIEQANSRHA